MAPDESRGTPRRGPEEPAAPRSSVQAGFANVMAAVRRAVGGTAQAPADGSLAPAPDRRPIPETPPVDDEPAPRPQSRRPSRRPQPRYRPDDPGIEASPAVAPPVEAPTSPPTGERPAPTSGEQPPPDRPRPEAANQPRTRRRLRRRRLRARKVKRVVRHIDPWSALKVSLLFYLAVFLIVMVAGVLLWRVARTTGAVEDVEDFITEYGEFGECEPVGSGATSGDPDETGTTLSDEEESQLAEGEEPEAGQGRRDEDGCLPGEELTGTFKFEGEKIFQGFVLGGLVLVVAGSAFNVVLVILFNLISDLTGGVRVTVLEEEPVPARARSRAPKRGTKPPKEPKASKESSRRKVPAGPPDEAPTGPPDQVATEPPRS